MTQSICILGGGISGLTAGAFLAQAGCRVTVLEKAKTVGGSAGAYVRQDRRFPAGATVAFGLEDGGLLTGLFGGLGIEVPAVRLAHPMDVVLPDRTVSVYQDRLRWKAELARVFPERAAEVLAFWKELSQIGGTVFGVTATGVSLPVRRLYDLGHLPGYALRHPARLLPVARRALWTVGDLLNAHGLGSYAPFRQFLDAQLMDAAQTDCGHAALLPASLALDIYRRGSYFVEGGLGQLSELLADRIRGLGGEVVMSSPVTSLIREDSSWRVVTRKRSDLYDVVLNSTGVSFGIGTSHAEDDAFSWGAFRIDAVLDERFAEEHLAGRTLPFALQIQPAAGHPVYEAGGHGPVYVTFLPSADGHGEPINGEIMMTCSIHTEPGGWERRPKEIYAERKRALADAMLAAIEDVMPIERYVHRSDAGTPATYDRYIGKTAVGGFPLTVRNAILQPNSVRSPLPDFYLAGEQSFPGPGTLSSALSGYHAARAILGGRIHPSFSGYR
ncbi:phytoene desaturase family protein [Sporosarcina trichiuri]|uniref:phytoene desaturase family protein n=1 Tax=Sporosarcina trichiuri TaxID=3056445 RepID=UPI0025B29693|nr:FAD-dependent oxidoreductase [Sporosarcina sp. 0.2-SM1T-5]WJY26819.1 FAD-dependent oxidoreductase [Sporosarcina sp. 0.2-SM1T-5]